MVTFQPTYEQYAEAWAVYTHELTDRQKETAHRSWSGVAVVFLLLLSFMLQAYLAPGWLGLAHFLMPTLGVGLYAMIALGRRPRTEGKRHPWLSQWPIAVLVIGGVSAVVWHVLQPEEERGWSYEQARGIVSTIVAAHSTWLIYTLSMSWAARGQQKKTWRQIWDGMTHLHQPQTFAWDDSGFSVSSASGQHSYLWTALIKATETQNLLLLYVGQSVFEVLPKAAFAPGQLLDLRQRIESHVGNIDRDPRAFPVVIKSA